MSVMTPCRFRIVPLTRGKMDLREITFAWRVERTCPAGICQTQISVSLPGNTIAGKYYLGAIR